MTVLNLFFRIHEYEHPNKEHSRANILENNN